MPVAAPIESSQSTERPPFDSSNPLLRPILWQKRKKVKPFIRPQLSSINLQDNDIILK